MGLSNQNIWPNVVPKYWANASPVSTMLAEHVHKRGLKPHFFPAESVFNLHLSSLYN